VGLRPQLLAASNFGDVLDLGPAAKWAAQERHGRCRGGPGLRPALQPGNAKSARWL